MSGDEVPVAVRPTPVRWYAALFPLGPRSAGGVSVRHPDHPDAEDGPPAGAAVPVSLSVPIPLEWNEGLIRRGDTTAAPVVCGRVEMAWVMCGRVEAAWVAEGLLHVLGWLDLAAPGFRAVVDAAHDMGVGGEYMSVNAELADVRHAGADVLTLTGWRLRAVSLIPGGRRGWPAPAGEFHVIPHGESDPHMSGYVRQCHGS